MIVSFDDGLRGNDEEGLEVLEGLGVPAVLLQSSGILAGGELGSHGHHHVPRCNISPAATVDGALLTPSTPARALPRFTWPGPHPNRLRRRRWLWTGTLAWPGR